MCGMRWLGLFSILLLTTGCVAPPMSPAAMREPQLQYLNERFVKLVAKIKSDRRYEWVHGWDGNTLVNEDEEDRYRGLCWQWAEKVYAHMKPLAISVGWQARRVVINDEWFSEHHAVVVFDPQRIKADELLDNLEVPAYVLDAWRNGRPEVYTLADWVDTPVIVFNSAFVLRD